MLHATQSGLFSRVVDQDWFNPDPEIIESWSKADPVHHTNFEDKVFKSKFQFIPNTTKVYYFVPFSFFFIFLIRDPDSESGFKNHWIRIHNHAFIAPIHIGVLYGTVVSVRKYCNFSDIEILCRVYSRSHNNVMKICIHTPPFKVGYLFVINFFLRVYEGC
jgi:hypothetical protein